MVFFQRCSLVSRKSALMGSDLSIEDGSRGEAPPAGEAISIEVCGARTWYGWENSG